MVAPPTLVDLRRGAPVTAGTFAHRATTLVGGWHVHDLHEIEYASSGVAEIVTPTAHYLLPPHHAAWIPAGVEHCPILRDVETVAVFFDSSEFRFERSEPVIIPVSPMLREMFLYARRWNIDRARDDVEAQTFFAALADVVRRQVPEAPDLSLPVSSDPVIADVMAYTTEHLAAVDVTTMCRSIGISPRTLRRRFPATTGQTWREYLQQARLFRAMALLSTSGPSVAEIAAVVGFESQSALARAFRAWTGEAPSTFRARWQDDVAPWPPRRATRPAASGGHEATLVPSDP